MNTTYCIECDREVFVEGGTWLGQHVTCLHCGTVMEVICVNPLELDWPQDEDSDEWDENESYDGFADDFPDNDEDDYDDDEDEDNDEEEDSLQEELDDFEGNAFVVDEFDELGDEEGDDDDDPYDDPILNVEVVDSDANEEQWY